MKRLLLILFIPVICFSQSDTLSITDKFFSNSHGAIIKKESKKVSKANEVMVEAYKLTNQKSGSILNYVSVGTVIIPMDEVQGIIDAIDYMFKTSSKESGAVNNEEYYYITESFIQIKLSNVPKGLFKGWYMVLGQKYRYVSGYYPDQFISEKPAVFIQISENLKTAKEMTF